MMDRIGLTLLLFASATNCSDSSGNARGGPLDTAQASHGTSASREVAIVPAVVDFGQASIQGSIVRSSMRIRAPQHTSLRLHGVEAADGDLALVRAEVVDGEVIAPGASRTIELTLYPRQAGSFSGSLIVRGWLEAADEQRRWFEQRVAITARLTIDPITTEHQPPVAAMEQERTVAVDPLQVWTNRLIPAGVTVDGTLLTYDHAIRHAHDVPKIESRARLDGVYWFRADMRPEQDSPRTAQAKSDQRSISHMLHHLEETTIETEIEETFELTAGYHETLMQPELAPEMGRSVADFERGVDEIVRVSYREAVAASVNVISGCDGGPSCHAEQMPYRPALPATGRGLLHITIASPGLVDTVLGRSYSLRDVSWPGMPTAVLRTLRDAHGPMPLESLRPGVRITIKTEVGDLVLEKRCADTELLLPARGTHRAWLADMAGPGDSGDPAARGAHIIYRRLLGLSIKRVIGSMELDEP